MIAENRHHCGFRGIISTHREATVYIKLNDTNRYLVHIRVQDHYPMNGHAPYLTNDVTTACKVVDSHTTYWLLIWKALSARHSMPKTE